MYRLRFSYLTLKHLDALYMNVLINFNVIILVAIKLINQVRSHLTSCPLRSPLDNGLVWGYSGFELISSCSPLNANSNLHMEKARDF